MPKRKSRKDDVRRNRRTIHVQPSGLRGLLGWQVTYDGTVVARVRTKLDAMNLGVLLAHLSSCESSTSLYEHNRNGQIADESTYTRKDDPRSTPG
jgi:hypothetical protein